MKGIIFPVGLTSIGGYGTLSQDCPCDSKMTNINFGNVFVTYRVVSIVKKDL